MHRLSSLVRVALGSALLLALGSACGGQSFSAGGDGGDAGSSQGGTTSVAGTTGTAGKGHAGRSSGGTSAGGTGNVAGMGGTGTAGTGTAGTTAVGGSGTGGAPDYGACNVAADCMLRGTGCCGVCDAPNLTTKDYIAFNRIYASRFQCGVPLPAVPASGGTSSAGATAPIACAPCPGLPAGEQGTAKYFVPDCMQGQCVVEDLRTSAVTACKSSDECKLRHGTGCCESCGTGDEISVRNDGSFEKLVCSSGPLPCPACEPLPSGSIAVCDTTVGRCSIEAPTL